MKKLFGGRKQDKSEQAARAGRWGGTHAAEQRAGAQAGAHDGGGGSGARGAEGRGGARAAGRGIRSGSGCPGLAPPRARWSRPGPAPPHLAKLLTVFRCRCAAASRDSPRQVRPAEPGGESGWSGAARGCASRATGPGSGGSSCPGPK